MVESNLQEVAEQADALINSFNVAHNWDLTLRDGDALGVFSHSDNGFRIETTGFNNPAESVRRIAVIGEQDSVILSYRRDPQTNGVEYAQVAEYSSPRGLEINMDAIAPVTSEDTAGERAYRRTPTSTFNNRLQIALSRDRDAHSAA